MHMVFKVYQVGKLIFTSTIKLQQGASTAHMNEFTKVAEIQFCKAHHLSTLPAWGFCRGARWMSRLARADKLGYLETASINAVRSRPGFGRRFVERPYEA
jgi:hypothetical protein